jgi:hypothetical protein
MIHKVIQLFKHNTLLLKEYWMHISIKKDSNNIKEQILVIKYNKIHLPK